MNRKIIVVGLGAGEIEQLPLGVYRKLLSAQKVYARTLQHPVIAELEQEGVRFASFDYIYEKYQTFEEVYQEICNVLIRMAEEEDVLFAVPGHPLVAERTVQLLLEQGEGRGVSISIEGGHSFIDAIFQSLQIDPIEGFQLLDATNLEGVDLQLKYHTIIGQVYDTFVASNTKLTLMEKLPDEYEIFIVTAAGTKHEEIKKIPLFELDREVSLNNLTSIYVPPVISEEILYKNFNKLREIIATLRGPNGCPWDRKQTHHSLKKYLLEEAYELIDAINQDDIDHMVEELGDVLLQIMLHGQIGEDEGYFTIDDVIEGISSKMVRRHPHVFGDVKAENEEDVLRNWQEIKENEKGNKPVSILAEINKAQPNLMRAIQLQKKAATVGFDWKDISPVWEKVKEEIREFAQEIDTQMSQGKIVEEFGDLLFALVNVARFYGIDPEDAIYQANEKFERRFSYIEEKVAESKKEFKDYSLEELDFFWEEAKKKGF